MTFTNILITNTCLAVWHSLSTDLGLLKHKSSSIFMLRNLMENEAFLYNIVFSCFLDALPDFLTVQQQVILPSGTGRLIYAAAWLGRKGRLGDS